MFRIKFSPDIDWVLVALVGFLSVIGLFSIYSASISYQFENDYFTKQFLWLGIGFGAMIFFTLLDYRLLVRWVWGFYAVLILALIYVLYSGDSTNTNVARWIVISGLSIQPSEFAKLIIVLMLANYYNDARKLGNPKLSNVLFPVFITLVPFLLVLIQPDLGTATILLIITSTLVFFSGIHFRWIIMGFVGLILSIPAIWIYILKDYQKNRILILLDPQRDPLGAGYHIIQSKIAIGSGKFFGKGFLEGKQAQLNFLPARHTDFIFSVFSEEWGFLGSIVVVASYGFLIFWILKEVTRFSDRRSVVVTVGIAMILASQGIINMGMVMGLFPVVGLPLPFMSYGGSSTITILAAMGILLNIRKKMKSIL